MSTERAHETCVWFCGTCKQCHSNACPISWGGSFSPPTCRHVPAAAQLKHPPVGQRTDHAPLTALADSWSSRAAARFQRANATCDHGWAKRLRVEATMLDECAETLTAILAIRPEEPAS